MKPYLSLSAKLPEYWILFLLTILPSCGIAQDKVVIHNQQVWLSYVTSIKISKHYAVWNDFHYVPDGFFVARTGLTHTSKYINITAGYAFLLLPVSLENLKLERKENRPWAQIVFALPVNGSVTLSQRIRYDARFKQDVYRGELQDEFSFTNRIRFLTAIKKSFLPDRKYTPFVAVSDEVLLNFGKNVSYNTFDQNRIMFSVGLQHGRTQYQTGFMNRFVQTGVSQYISNNTLVFWVTQKF